MAERRRRWRTEVLLPTGSDAYGMLRRPPTPTALVEFGYLANGAEADLFATYSYISAASTAAADAIETYLTIDQQGVARLQPPRVFTPASALGADSCTDPDLE